MDANELRNRGKTEILDLGPEPADMRESAAWEADRRGAAMLLAELADNDAELLRRVASGEWVTTLARDLLLDAVREVGSVDNSYETDLCGDQCRTPGPCGSMIRLAERSDGGSGEAAGAP